MDTKSFETKKVLVFPANLLQQKNLYVGYTHIIPLLATRIF
jgi:hypothetical protein